MLITHGLRVVAAGFSYVLFAIGASIPAVYCATLRLLRVTPERQQSQARGLIRYLSRFYVNTMQFLGLYRYHIEDQRVQESAGQLIVANHPMLIDALFVLAFVPNVCCIAKPALATNPFTRATIKAAGYLTSGGEDFIEQVAQKLARNESVLIFPEGTRTRTGHDLEFKRGAANIAVLCDCAIQPIVLSCKPDALQKGVPWYQIPEKVSRIDMRLCQSLELADCIDTSAPRTQQYRALTRYLHAFFVEQLHDLHSRVGEQKLDLNPEQT